jgi:hypothetical protein
VFRTDVVSGVRQKSRIEEFFHTQEDAIQQAERDAAEDANRVHGSGDHVSAVSPPRDESELRTIIDAMESLLPDAHRLCLDGHDCMLTY